MPGDTIILTGAGAGLGNAIAHQLVKLHNKPNCILTVRPTQNESSEQYTSLKSAVASSDTKSSIQQIELSTLAGVRSFAENINSRVASEELTPIKCLILNAAVQNSAGMKFSSDGFELQFQVNYLANFLLTLLLLQSMDKHAGRIVMVSSDSHDPDSSFGMPHPQWAEPSLLAKPPQDSDEIDPYTAGMRRYGQSKLWMVMFMYELQRRLDSNPELRNICALSVDPGWMATSLVREGPKMLKYLIVPLMKYSAPIMTKWKKDGKIQSTESSARAVVNASTSSIDEAFGGVPPKAVFMIGMNKGMSGKMAREEMKQKELWRGSVGFAGLKEGDSVLDVFRET